MKSIKIFLSCLVLLSVFASCNREQYQKLVEAESCEVKGGWVVDPHFVEQWAHLTSLHTDWEFPLKMQNWNSLFLQKESTMSGQGQKTGFPENGKLKEGFS